jgi:hypothetical protein
VDLPAGEDGSRPRVYRRRRVVSGLVHRLSSS